MNDGNSKVEMKTSPTDVSVDAAEKRGSEMPLFELLKMAMPGVFFRGIAEQSVGRVKVNCEKMKATSEEMADVLRETYSINANGIADYGTKVIEFSGANTTSVFSFLTNLMGTKSPTEIMQLSAAQARKSFDVTSAQNKELWDLAQKVAVETAEPIKKSLARALQKVT